MKPLDFDISGRITLRPAERNHLTIECVGNQLSVSINEITPLVWRMKRL